VNFKLDRERFDIVKKSILNKTFLKFLNNSADYLSSNKTDLYNISTDPRISQLKKTLKKQYDNLSPRRMLLEVEKAIKSDIGIISPLKKDREQVSLIKDLYTIIYKILACYTPEIASNYTISAEDNNGLI
jgi:hypothetical protein